MTYFRMGSPHYHRRAAVSRSCSGWEGVVPAGYGRQALSGGAAGAWSLEAAAEGRSKDWVGAIGANTATGQCTRLWSQAARAISIG